MLRKSKRRPPDAALHTWVADPLSPELRATIDRIRRLEGVVHVAIMPDVHIAGPVCNGGVVATTHTIYPQAIGGDIGCGYAGVALDVGADLLSQPERISRLFGELRERVPFMRHRSLASAPTMPDALLHTMSTELHASVRMREMGVEFGTLGRGNHFLELQCNDDGRLWVMVHSGSRALGPALSSWHLKQTAVERRSGLVGLDAAADCGRAFIHDAMIADRFAAASRARMVEQAIAALNAFGRIQPDEDTRFNTSHNHVRAELHGLRTLWVHRKGANSAALGEFNVIPGSMGSTTYHTCGRGHADSLRSSSHGAGRALTRLEARRRISSARLASETADVQLDPAFHSQFVEESPSAYKPIERVMRAQRDLVRVIRRLRPLLVHRAP